MIFLLSLFSFLNAIWTYEINIALPKSEKPPAGLKCSLKGRATKIVSREVELLFTPTPPHPNPRTPMFIGWWALANFENIVTQFTFCTQRIFLPHGRITLKGSFSGKRFHIAKVGCIPKRICNGSSYLKSPSPKNEGRAHFLRVLYYFGSTSSEYNLCTHWGIQRVNNFIAKRLCYEVTNSLNTWSQFPKLSTLFHRKVLSRPIGQKQERKTLGHFNGSVWYKLEKPEPIKCTLHKE